MSLDGRFQVAARCVWPCGAAQNAGGELLAPVAAGRARIKVCSVDFTGSFKLQASSYCKLVQLIELEVTRSKPRTMSLRANEGHWQANLKNAQLESRRSKGGKLGNERRTRA